MRIGSNSGSAREGRPSESDTVRILVNVVWIVGHLDGPGLAELGDVPVLELAKHVSIVRSEAARGPSP